MHESLKSNQDQGQVLNLIPAKLMFSRAAYVNRKGEVKWNLQDLEVPTVEQCVKEDALEVQDIRELGLGWAWFVNDLRAFLSAWQDMELATPSTEEPVTQIAGDVPVEPLPLQADATQLEMDLQAYERPLAVTPFGTPELVPDWQDMVETAVGAGPFAQALEQPFLGIFSVSSCGCTWSRQA